MPKRKKENKERWSKWFLKGILIASFLYIAKWSWSSFFENHCINYCTLPTAGLTGVFAVIIFAVIDFFIRGLK